MKKILILMTVLILLITIGCTPLEETPGNGQMSITEKILSGEHLLQKMDSSKATESQSRGDFFLFAGEYKSRTDSKIKIIFSWQMNEPDSIYAISSLDMTKIRIKFDNKIKSPTILFKWEQGCYEQSDPQIQYLMDNKVIYAIVTIQEKDWPKDIKLPINETPSK